MTSDAPPSGRPRGLFLPSQLSPRTVLVAAVTLLFLGAVLWILVRAPFALGVTLAAALIACALDQLVRRLERWLPRGLAIALVLVGLVGVAAGIGFIVVPPTLSQAQSFVHELPELLAKLRGSELYRHLDERFQLGARLGDLQLSTLATRYAGRAVDAVRAVLTGLLAFVTVFFLVIFMLVYGREVVRRWLSETTPERRPRYERSLSRIYHSLGGYLGGLAVIVALHAGFTTAFLAILGVPYYFALGLLSGLFSLIPVIGALADGGLMAAVAFGTGGLWSAVAVVIYYVVYQQVENHVWSPFVYKRTVRLNPLVTIVGVLFLTECWGLAGALAAVPAIAAAQVVLGDLLELRRHRIGLPESPSFPRRLPTD